MKNRLRVGNNNLLPFGKGLTPDMFIYFIFYSNWPIGNRGRDRVSEKEKEVEEEKREMGREKNRERERGSNKQRK